MPGRIDFNMTFSDHRTGHGKKRGEPMRILLLGNFSGSDRQRLPALSGRRIYPIDVDNFDELMTRLSPQLRYQTADQTGSQIDLKFRTLDDFHPDALFKRLKLFQSLRGMRSNLLNKNTFHQVVEDLKGASTAPTLSKETAQHSPQEEDLFGQLLGKKPDKQQLDPAVGKAQADQFIRALVHPHIVPAPDPQLQNYLDAVDDAVSSEMRRLLHNQEFQALESLWRSLYHMVTRLETGDTLELYLLDVSLQELMVDLVESKHSLQKSALYTLLIKQGIETPGGKPWSAIVGDYCFGLREEELGLLNTLGAISARAGGPFLASAASDLIGCSSLAKTPRPGEWQPLENELENQWQSLRASSYASWIGLVLPRILLRMPYGPKTDEIDSFEFEEIPFPPGSHEHYLWGSSAYACAMLLAAGYLKNGDSMQPGDSLDLEDLPAFVFEIDKERQLKPCAETYLTEAAGEAILERGIMPFLSYKNRNTARLLQFCSIASPPSVLNGFWS